MNAKELALGRPLMLSLRNLVSIDEESLGNLGVGSYDIGERSEGAVVICRNLHGGHASALFRRALQESAHVLQKQVFGTFEVQHAIDIPP